MLNFDRLDLPLDAKGFLDFVCQSFHEEFLLRLSGVSFTQSIRIPKSVLAIRVIADKVLLVGFVNQL